MAENITGTFDLNGGWRSRFFTRKVIFLAKKPLRHPPCPRHPGRFKPTSIHSYPQSSIQVGHFLLQFWRVNVRIRKTNHHNTSGVKQKTREAECYNAKRKPFLSGKCLTNTVENAFLLLFFLQLPRDPTINELACVAVFRVSFWKREKKKKKTRKIRKVPFLAPTLARLPSSTLPGRLAKLVETETTATQAIDERTTTTVTSIFFIPDHCINPNCCALCPLQ